jgi:hypothetical protein
MTYPAIMASGRAGPPTGQSLRTFFSLGHSFRISVWTSLVVCGDTVSRLSLFVMVSMALCGTRVSSVRDVGIRDDGEGGGVVVVVMPGNE